MPNKGQGEGVGAGGCSLSREQVKGERVHSCEAEKRASSTARDVKLEKELTEPGVGGSLPVKGVLWDAVCRSWSDAGIHQGEGPSSTEKGPVLTCRILRRSDFDGRLQNVNKVNGFPGIYMSLPDDLMCFFHGGCILFPFPTVVGPRLR